MKQSGGERWDPFNIGCFDDDRGITCERDHMYTFHFHPKNQPDNKQLLATLASGADDIVLLDPEAPLDAKEYYRDEANSCVGFGFWLLSRDDSRMQAPDFVSSHPEVARSW